MVSMRTFSIIVLASSLYGCGGNTEYSALLINGMDGNGMADVRIVARSTPPSADMTCRVRESTSGADGRFSFANLCRNQAYSMTIPAPTMHLSGTNIISGNEPAVDGTHQVWPAPDGQGVYRLSGEKVQSLPTFSDVTSDETLNGQAVRYPTLKPTGKVITIAPGEHLIVAGKNWVRNQKIYPLVTDKGRRKLRSGIISDHVFIGVQWTGGDVQQVEAKLDASKIKDVLIRGEGVRYVAHDAVPAGRYALLADGDARVTVIDFGSSQAPAK